MAERLCLDVLELAPDRHGALSILLDQVGLYENAWAAFAEGKRLAREQSGQVDDRAPRLRPDVPQLVARAISP